MSGFAAESSAGGSASRGRRDPGISSVQLAAREADAFRDVRAAGRGAARIRAGGFPLRGKVGGGGAPRRIPSPTSALRNRAADGVWIRRPGARAHRPGVWVAGPLLNLLGNPLADVGGDATRRARRRCIAAFVAGGSAFAASSRSESDGWRRRSSAASWTGAARRSSAPGRGARARPRTARGRRGSDGRGWRDRRSRAGWPRPGARRRAPAPPARERSRLRRRPQGTPRSASQPFAYAAECDSRSSDAHADALGRGNPAHERCAGVERRPQLEVRRPRAGERAAAEEGAAQVGRAAARPRDDVPRRTVERKRRRGSRRRPGPARRSCAPSRRRAAACGRRRRRRGAGTCGSPRRLGARGGSRRHAARPPTRRRRGGRRARRGRGGGRCRRVEERRDLGEPVAAPRRRNGGELGARIGGERVDAHRSVPSSASSRRLRR